MLAPLVLEPTGPLRTMGDLLDVIVRHQVAEFNERKGKGRFLRVLTERECVAGREIGRIVSGEIEPDDRRADAEKAVADAVSAFLDGFYFVFVNDVQVEGLEQDIRDVRNVLFVRLTPLAGG